MEHVYRNIDRDVEWRLQEWGRWSRQGNHVGIGYSNLSNIGKIAANGGVYIKSEPAPIGDNLVAEEIEKNLVVLARYCRREVEAVRAYYCSNLDKSAVALRLKISLRTLNARLQAAKHWLAGRLSAKYA